MHPNHAETREHEVGRPSAPTPTANADLPLRRADFATLAEALDYAARGATGLNFHGSRGELERVLPYADLRARARRVARAYHALGLARGDRVAIVAQTDADFAVAFFACQYAGMIAVPLPEQTGIGNRDGYVAAVRAVLVRAGARAVVGPATLRATLAQAASELPGPHVVTLDDLPAPDPELTLRPLGPDEISHIQYSSGSTRTPQGIRISQAALMANARSVAGHGLEICAGDRAASWLPFYHDMGLIGFLLITVSCQVSVDYLSPSSFARRPLQWLRLISDNRCTLAFSPTFGYELCTRRAGSADALELDLSCWRAAGIGGEPIRHETLDAFSEAFAPHGFRQSAFLPSYGLAEATLAVSFDRLDADPTVDRIDGEAFVRRGVAQPAGTAGRRSSFTSCGVAMPDHEIQIRNRQNRPLGERQVGRIWVRGPSLMQGYDGQPDAAGDGVDANGWLDTGDLGYLVRQRLYVTGRDKDLIIINGRNILPQDLEWYAERHAGGLRSRDTAAFGLAGEDGREIPVILVQARSGDPEDRTRLRRSVHAALFRNAGVDCRVVLIPPRSLPFTSSGKLSRARARQMYLDGAFDIDDLPRAAAGA